MHRLIFGALTASCLATSVAYGGTISFTPVPYVDMTQPFLPDQAPTVFEVRLASAFYSTVGSMDVIIGTPLVGSSLSVNFPNDAGNYATPDSFILAPQFVADFPLNSVLHPGDAPPWFPSSRWVPPVVYLDAIQTGGFAFVPRSTAGGFLIGTLTIDPLTESGVYSFGVSSLLDGNRSDLAAGGSRTDQVEPLFGSVTINVIPEPATVLLLGLAALGLIRRRCAAPPSASREAAERV